MRKILLPLVFILLFALTAYATTHIDGGGSSGSGDLVSTNNLSDVADAATALSNLGGESATSNDIDPDRLNGDAVDNNLLDHEIGGLEADISTYTGLLGVTGGATLEINTAEELESIAGLGAFFNEYADDADAATMRATLGLTIGTDVQAYHATLASLSGLTEAAGSIIYCTADNTYAVLGEGSNDGYVLAINTTTHTPYWKQDADSGGATALDDIGDPDAATLISMDDNESLTLSSAEDTGTVMIITNTDADLSGATSMLDLKYTDDGSANGYFLRGYDNSGNDLKFYIGADGEAVFGAITCSSVTADPTASPYIVLRDSDGAGADNADKEAAKWYAQMTTTTEDGEVSDFRLTSFGAGAAGTEYTNVWFDSSDAALYLGVQTNADAPAEVAGYEYLKFDFNTATDAEIGISSVATTLNFGTLAMVTTGTIAGKMIVETDADGKALDIGDCVGTIQMATGAGTWTLPDIDASNGTGWSVMVYSTGANAIVVAPNAEDKIRNGGTLAAAGKNITSASEAGNFVCLVVTDFDGDIAIWTTLGSSGTWTTEE